jgi:hypothetical protein
VLEWFKSAGYEEEAGSNERQCYWYSGHLATYLLLFKFRDQLKINKLITWDQLSESSNLSRELDSIREQLLASYTPMIPEGGPRWFFGHSYWVVRIAEEISIVNYRMSQPDPVLERHKSHQDGSRDKRVALFSYLASKAPQIEI